MAFLTNSQLYTFITETTPGTFNPAVSATDVAVRMREISWGHEIDKDNEASSYHTGYIFQSDESVIGKRAATNNVSIKLAPGVFTPATSATPASHELTYAPLLESCSMKCISATGGSEGVWAFYPDQSMAEHTLSTARVMYDPTSNKYAIDQASGVMYNVNIKSDGVGSPYIITFDGKGAAQPAINATIGVAKLDETKVMRTVADSLRNTTIKLTDLSTSASNTFCISTVEIASGVDYTEIECSDSDNGIKNRSAIKFNPSFTINPLLKTLAEHNWWEAITREKMFRVELDSEYFSLYIPRAQILTVTNSDDNGVIRSETTLRPLVNLDNDKPSWVSVAPTNAFAVPYYVGIRESQKQY